MESGRISGGNYRVKEAHGGGLHQAVSDWYSQKWPIGKIVTAFPGGLNVRMERKRRTMVNPRFGAWATGKVRLEMEKVQVRAVWGIKDQFWKYMV